MWWRKAVGERGEVFPALLVSAMMLTNALSFTLLIFSGPLGAHLATAIPMAFVTCAALQIVTACFSTFRFAIAGAPPTGTAILATAAAGLTAQLGGERAFPSVVAMLTVSALSSAIVLWGIGAFRLGRAVRYIPYPVVAGFMAATGLLQIAGMTRTIGPAAPSFVLQTIVAVVFAAALFVALRAVRSPWIYPLVVLAGTLAVHAGLGLAHLDRAAARAQGWLYPAFVASHPNVPFDLVRSRDIDWLALGQHAGDILTVSLVAALVVLFGTAGLEAESGVDADVDRELRVQGAGNLLSAICGGFAGNMLVSQSLGNRRAGSRSRVSGLIVACVAVAFVLVKNPALLLLPKVIIAGILLASGALLVNTWLIVAGRRISRSDVAIIVVIMVAALEFSFLVAIVAGLAISCFTFAISYGRHRVVRHRFTGKTLRSRVERTPRQRAALDAHGDRFVVLQLHGYLFFGSANAIVEEMRAIAAIPAERRARVVVLDFAHVDGIDASAGIGLQKVVALAAAADMRVVFSATDPVTTADLRRRGLLRTEPSNAFDDLDHAIDACEEALLAELDGAISGDLDYRAELAHSLGDEGLAVRLEAYGERRVLAAGDVLFERGERSDAFYLVVAGRLEIRLDDVRLGSIVAGSIVGELGIYTGEPRRATVAARGPVTVTRIPAAALALIESRDPLLMRAVHTFVVRVQAARLDLANAELGARR